jgi:hypothetical protein
MATTTAIYGWPVPDLTDTPNEPQQVSDLADAIEATLGVDKRPIGDPSNSAFITGGDIAFAANDNKNIISVSISLARDQYVVIGGRAMFEAQGAACLIGIYIDLGGGTPIDELTSGVCTIGANSGDHGRLQLTIPPHYVLLTAGAHTIRLRATHDATTSAVVNASAAESLTVAFKPCFLSIIV